MKQAIWLMVILIMACHRPADDVQEAKVRLRPAEGDEGDAAIYNFE